VTDIGLLELGPPAFVAMTTVVYRVSGVRLRNIADPELVSLGTMLAPDRVKVYVTFATGVHDSLKDSDVILLDDTIGGETRVVIDIGLLGLGPPAFVAVTTMLY
jgi:hypothetical protein